jgi:hypothetical protein
MKHPVKIEDMAILASVDSWSKRRVREDIEIVKIFNCLNHDDGLIISGTWLPAVIR